MPKKSKIIVINLLNGEIDLFKNKQDAAEKVGIHRNSMIPIKDRATFGNYLVIIANEK
jgi:hypothetical protein